MLWKLQDKFMIICGNSRRKQGTQHPQSYSCCAFDFRALKSCCSTQHRPWLTKSFRNGFWGSNSCLAMHLSALPRQQWRSILGLLHDALEWTLIDWSLHAFLCLDKANAPKEPSAPSASECGARKVVAESKPQIASNENDIWSVIFILQIYLL